MPKFVDGWWPGNPAGATRASRQPCRFRSFVPDLLVGQDLTLPSAIAADLVDVETQIRALNAATGPAINLEPLARFLLRAEAVASSNIEGLQINVRRLARKEAAVREGWDATDDMAAAVLGNIRAVDRALSIAVNADAAITVDTIREIHAALLEGTRERAWAGVVRHEQNWIGGPHPGAAAFVPPPPDRVPELLVDLAAYLSRDDHPALLQAALAHSQFETIHPFADGNGRTGRALIQLVLRRRGLAPSVVPPISLVLATESSRYIDALMATRSVEAPQTGMLEWVGLFVDVTARACLESLRFGHQLHDLESLHRERAGRVRADSATDRLIRVLPALPVFTVKTAADAIGRSQVAVGQAVDRLLAAGVVRQITVGRRNRAFEATEILDAFTGFERALASPRTDTSVAPPVRPVPAPPGSRGSVRHRG